MILIGIGSNLDGPWGNSGETVAKALRELGRDRLTLIKASRLLRSRPYGNVHQPAFVNAVAEIATHLPPEALLARLHAIERAAGRRRAKRWGPRTLDLDLLDYHGRVCGGRLTLPHPGIADRLFVLVPIAEIAPRWVHPVRHATARNLMQRLGASVQGSEI